MTFRIDRALVAAFVISLLCAWGAPAKADTSAGDGKDPAVSASHSHRAHAKRQPQTYTTVLPSAPQPQYREFLWQPYGWGGPPLQDSRDAYHGYFANPLDDPRYSGSGRTTLIFR